MFRTALVFICLFTVLAGPFVAIAATSVQHGYGNRNAKPMCYFAGIACSKGPTLLPALTRLK